MLVLGTAVISPGAPKMIATPITADISNTEALGLVLYTRYVYFFQAAGLVLLVAMIGAIVLTLAPPAERQAPEYCRAERAHQGDRDRNPPGAAGAGDLAR